MNRNLILGLKDVKIVSFSEVNGKLEVLLEKASSSAICPHCHHPSTSIKERKCYKIMDKPTDCIPSQLLIQKRVFFCNNPTCPNKSFTEEISGLPKKSSYTQNFKDFLGELHWDMDYPTIKRHLARKYKLNLSLSTIHRLPKEFLVKKFDLFPSSLRCLVNIPDSISFLMLKVTVMLLP